MPTGIYLSCAEITETQNIPDINDDISIELMIQIIPFNTNYYINSFNYGFLLQDSLHNLTSNIYQIPSIINNYNINNHNENNLFYFFTLNILQVLATITCPTKSILLNNCDQSTINTEKEESTSIPIGLIIGIIVGVLIGCICCLLVIYLLLIMRRKKRTLPPPPTPIMFSPAPLVAYPYPDLAAIPVGTSLASGETVDELQSSTYEGKPYPPAQYGDGNVDDSAYEGKQTYDDVEGSYRLPSPGASPTAYAAFHSPTSNRNANSRFQQRSKDFSAVEMQPTPPHARKALPPPLPPRANNSKDSMKFHSHLI